MKIAVIGGVNSTYCLIEKLHEKGFRDVHVFGYAPLDNSNVSGWTDLEEIAERFDFIFTPFRKVEECESKIRDFGPRILFAVGISQILSAELLSIAEINIGFHPTALPKGRGRAAIAWLILEITDGASTFFVISKGIDDGPILSQVPYVVNTSDDAKSVEAKILAAEQVALDELLPRLVSGNFCALPQDHTKATWYGRRIPADGRIDWADCAIQIDALIRASTHPHPGAFTFDEDTKIFIWKAQITERKETAISGRIVLVDEHRFVVCCGKGMLEILSWESSSDWVPRVGRQLGYDPEMAIWRLRQVCSTLEERISLLESKLDFH